ncbi:MAG: esterase-like activity of phytase family protein [Thiohalocapsa sp.]
MKLKPFVASLALTAAVIPSAQATFGSRTPETFRPVATFDVTRNEGSKVAEIVDVTKDGKTLVYTDSPGKLLGFVDITDPSAPQEDGIIPLDGEPTSVAVRGRYALIGVNTSEVETCTFDHDGDEETISIITDWSGKLVIIDIPTRAEVKQIDLDGQPDSVAVSPDGRYAAIAIENERNEDASDGLIPQGGVSTPVVETEECEYQADYDPLQNPAVPGKLVIVDLKGNNPFNWTARDVESLVGLPGMFAAADPEPEFVDINRANLAALTLQENNHIAIFDLRSGRIVKQFPAGSVELQHVDTKEDDLIKLDSNITKRREPDSVAWTGILSVATANEGDYEDESGEEGGSRGFTIFNKWGVSYESYESFEHELVSAGHYNEGRSENKGIEPESIEYGRFGRDRLLFVGSERSNAVGIYKLRYFGVPELLQVLPTGIGPEGLKAIPQRHLFVASTETDVFDDGIPTMINIYKRQPGPANYPQIASANDPKGLPIPWVALSDLVGDPVDPQTLYAVSDSFLAKGFVYTIDVSEKPALIVDRLEVDSDDALDLEGIAVGPDGSFWLGSEGNTGSRENLVLKVNPVTGAVLQTIELPSDLVDERRGNGIEGIAVTGSDGSEVVYVVIQRAWPDEGDIDEVNTKIGRYDVATGEWGFVHYPLEAEGGGDWIGLSGITAMPNGNFWVIERAKGWGGSGNNIDNRPPTAELKAFYEVDLASAEFKRYNEDLATESLERIGKTLIKNLTETMAENSIWTSEKLEGLAVGASDGSHHELYAVTDNDGVDDATGETLFLRLGHFATFGTDN